MRYLEIAGIVDRAWGVHVPRTITSGYPVSNPYQELIIATLTQFPSGLICHHVPMRGNLGVIQRDGVASLGIGVGSNSNVAVSRDGSPGLSHRRPWT